MLVLNCIAYKYFFGSTNYTISGLVSLADLYQHHHHPITAQQNTEGFAACCTTLKSSVCRIKDLKNGSYMIDDLRKSLRVLCIVGLQD